MKSSTLYLLVTVAAFFVMCGSVLAVGPQSKNPRLAKGSSDFADRLSKPSIIQSACLKCHGGASVNGDLDFTRGLTSEQKLDAITKAARGEMPKNGPKLTPPQLSQLKKELGIKNAGASSAPNGAPPASPLAKTPAPKPRSLKATTPVSSKGSTLTAPPQAHISVVPASDNIPTARVQVVPPVATKSLAAVGTAKVHPIANVAPLKPRLQNILPPAGLAKDDAKPQQDLSAAEDTSKVADEIKGLVGDWMAVSRQGDGELSTVELQLDDHGWAKLTIPGADGKSSTTTRKVELEKNELKLTGASSSPDVSLGKLVSVDSHQMVLERSSGLVTFVRP